MCTTSPHLEFSQLLRTRAGLTGTGHLDAVRQQFSAATALAPRAAGQAGQNQDLRRRLPPQSPIGRFATRSRMGTVAWLESYCTSTLTLQVFSFLGMISFWDVMPWVLSRSFYSQGLEAHPQAIGVGARGF